jgi:transcriptional regulator with XRE-family HTH domain
MFNVGGFSCNFIFETSTYGLEMKNKIRQYLREKEITSAEFASIAGVSPATVSRVLNGVASINTRTLVKLSSAIGEPINGLINVENINLKNTFHATKFHENSFSESEHIFIEAFAKSNGKFSIYICDTIPEILKQSYTLKCELGPLVDADEYAKTLSEMKTQLVNEKNWSGIILIDEQVYESLLTGGGLYSALSDVERKNQLKTLYASLTAIAPKVLTYVTNFRKSGLSTVFTIETGYGVQFEFGGYREWQSKAMFEIIKKQVLLAIQNGRLI